MIRDYMLGGKNLRKKVFLLIALIGILALLSGCTDINEDITPESTGFWNKYFVYPMSWFITCCSDLFGWNYVLGIVFVTFIVRLVLLPLYIKQSKSSKAM